MTMARAIPDDPALPQLAAWFDTARMAGELELAMRHVENSPADSRHAAFKVRDCRIERVKYKPGNNCLINYRLRVENEYSAQLHEQILCARGYAPGASRARFEKGARQTLHRPDFGPPLFHIDSLSLVVWAFPNDRKLDGLVVLRDGDRLQRSILPPIVHARWGADWSISDLVHSIAHYEPEHTCCIRVEMALRHRHSGEKRNWVVFGKTYYDEQGEAAFCNMQQLSIGIQQIDAPALSIPRPLAYLPPHRLLWQEGIVGETVLERHPDYRIERSMLTGMAGAIAALHLTPIETRQRICVTDLVARLRELEPFLSTIQPSCITTLRRVVLRLVEAAPNDDGAIATLHGDLHLRNVFISRQRIALIDLDTLSAGPPLYDIGTLVATILINADAHGTATESTQQMINILVGSYRTQVPWRVSASAVHWHTATALVTIWALRCVKRLETGWQDKLLRIIALAGRITAGGTP